MLNKTLPKTEAEQPSLTNLKAPFLRYDRTELCRVGIKLGKVLRSEEKTDLNLQGSPCKPYRLSTTFCSTADAVGECATRNLAPVPGQQSEKSLCAHVEPPVATPLFAQCSSPYWLGYAASAFLPDRDSVIAVSQKQECLETVSPQCQPVDCRFVSKLRLLAADGPIAVPGARLEGGV